MASRKARTKRQPAPMPGAWYDERAAEAAVQFFARHLKFTTGEWAGRPFVLAPWQADKIIRPLFGWKRDDGARLYRRCYVEIPRKNGKTELGAGVAILCLLGDAEMGGQGYALASKESQARIVFSMAQQMIAQSPVLSASIELLKSACYCPSLNASFKPLSGLPKGTHGFNCSFMIGDELHEWPDDRLYKFVHQSTGARRQPLEFLITTAGTRRGFGWEMHCHARKVLDGVIDDPELLVVIYGADAEDDWQDEKTWRKANPNLGISPKLGYMRSEARLAKESIRYENDFRRYHLNQWVEQDVRWLPMDKWRACAGPVEWRALAKFLRGRKCFGGLDLSATTDVTALLLMFPPGDGLEQWTALPRFFIPEARMEERVRRDRVPYDTWSGIGAIEPTPGNVVDYNRVRQRIEEDAGEYQIMAIGVDRWNSSQMVIDLQEQGAPVVWFGQGFASMSAPSKMLEGLVVSKGLAHGGHPVLEWMASNVAAKTDPAGNIKPDKAASTDRIDGIVAMIMGLGMSISDEVEGPSYLDSQDVAFV